ncbi:MAG: beta-lactamase family protein [Polyangiaceae bacterium]|nr:beta-lactamase family protein [Polyangiaceae bacterium]
MNYSKNRTEQAQIEGRFETELEKTLLETSTATHCAAAATRLHGDGEESFSAWAGPTKTGDLFDLASITKTITALTTHRYLRSQGLSLDVKLGSLLPVARQRPIGAISLRTILAHRSGLPAHLELSQSRNRFLFPTLAHLQEMVASQPLQKDTELYSDLGYQLLGWALSHSSGWELDDLMQEFLFAPLALEIGSARQWGTRSGKSRPNREENSSFSFVPSEYRWQRGGLLRGRVHDDNAWVLSGFGSSGHAGLFGTLKGVRRWAQLLLQGALDKGPLRESMAELLQKKRSARFFAGFDSKSPQGSSAGESPSTATFGHLGFTGTSFWCDPEKAQTSVLLTNRVFYGWNPAPIKKARRHVHDWAWKTLNEKKGRSAL